MSEKCLLYFLTVLTIHYTKEISVPKEIQPGELTSNFTITASERSTNNTDATLTDDNSNNNSESTRISGLTSTLVVTAIVPGFCCVFFICFKCRCIKLLETFGENIKAKITRRKTSRYDIKPNENTNDDIIETFRVQPSGEITPIETPSRHGRNITSLQMSTVEMKSKVSQTICCNFVCVCVRLGNSKDQEKTTIKRALANIATINHGFQSTSDLEKATVTHSITAESIMSYLSVNSDELELNSMGLKEITVGKINRVKTSSVSSDYANISLNEVML